jgi:hypothetical protein
MLAEARKYGLGAILSTQALASLRAAGDDVLDAVKNMTNTKAVLRIKNPEEAAELAEMVLQYDLEMPVRSLIKPSVIGQRVVRLKGESTSQQSATTTSRSRTIGESVTESYTHAESIGETTGEAIGFSQSASNTVSTGTSTGEVAGEGSGTATTIQFVPSGDVFAANPVVGFAQGSSAQSHTAQSRSSQLSAACSSGISTSRSSTRAVSTSESWSEGVAYGRSGSDSTGSAETHGQAGNDRMARNIRADPRRSAECAARRRGAAIHGIVGIARPCDRPRRCQLRGRRRHENRHP